MPREAMAEDDGTRKRRLMIDENGSRGRAGLFSHFSSRRA